MLYGVLIFVGVVLVIVTAILNRQVANQKKTITKSTKIFLHLLVISCIFTIGGLCGGWLFFGLIGEERSIPETIFVSLFVVSFNALICIIGHAILFGFQNESIFTKISHVCFVTVFILSSVFWGFQISGYNHNIESVKETVVISNNEYKLYYFRNMPVQKVSGNISGDFVLGTGSISGNISTSDEIPFWYENENGSIVYGSVSAQSSTLAFISDNEVPNVEIVTYRTQTKTINYNNGKESTQTNAEWTEYYFHLPEEFKQFSLN